MKIALINPPWYFANINDKIISQNLGIGYLASFLRSHNISVCIIDSLSEGFNIHQTIKRKNQDAPG